MVDDNEETPRRIHVEDVIPTLTVEDIDVPKNAEEAAFIEDVKPKVSYLNFGGPKAKAPRKPVPKVKKGSLTEPLMGFYAAIAMGVGSFDPVCATAIMQSGEQCAIAWDELAQQNDAVRRMLLAITHTTAWGAVITAHIPIIITVSQHHVPEIAGYMPGVVAAEEYANNPEDESA